MAALGLRRRSQPPVSVSFVWDAQYAGIHFPKKRTTVLEVKAPQRSLYWRAAVLDDFVGDRWVEGPALRADALEPSTTSSYARTCRCSRSRTRTSSGRACRCATTRATRRSSRACRGSRSSASGLTRGFRYTVWSDAPQPTAAELAHSKADLSGSR